MQEKKDQAKDQKSEWAPVPFSQEMTEEMELGECRFYPPQIDFESQQSSWPITSAEMGCYQNRAKTKGWGKTCRNCKAWRKLNADEIAELITQQQIEDALDEIEDGEEPIDPVVAESHLVEAEERAKEKAGFEPEIVSEEEVPEDAEPADVPPLPATGEVDDGGAQDAPTE